MKKVEFQNWGNQFTGFGPGLESCPFNSRNQKWALFGEFLYMKTGISNRALFVVKESNGPMKIQILSIIQQSIFVGFATHYLI